MAGDDTGTLMSFHDVAAELEGKFPSHWITVEGGRRGLRFAATRKPGEAGPAVIIGAASEIRDALGGKPA
jgi:hypothetical protein